MFFINSHYDEEAVLLAVGITAVRILSSSPKPYFRLKKNKLWTFLSVLILNNVKVKYIYEYPWSIWKVSQGLKSIFSVQYIIKIDSKEVNFMLIKITSIWIQCQWQGRKCENTACNVNFCVKINWWIFSFNRVYALDLSSFPFKLKWV